MFIDLRWKQTQCYWYVCMCACVCDWLRLEETGLWVGNTEQWCINHINLWEINLQYVSWFLCNEVPVNSIQYELPTSLCWIILFWIYFLQMDQTRTQNFKIAKSRFSCLILFLRSVIPSDAKALFYPNCKLSPNNCLHAITRWFIPAVSCAIVTLTDSLTQRIYKLAWLILFALNRNMNKNK